MRILKYAILVIFAFSHPGQSQARQAWVGTWTASPLLSDNEDALPAADLLDVTLRQTVHVSTAGSTLRIHLSNSFGTRPLHITSVHLARPKAAASSAIDPATDRTVLFNGSAEMLIPPGAEFLSDPILYPLTALSDLTVSIHVEADPGGQTGHPGSRQTSFYAHGDLTAAADMPSATKVDRWYFLSAVEVLARRPATSFSIVTLGDSITDGHASTTNGNDRWPDILAQRLQANPATRGVGVLNQGIGGNHLLSDGIGPNALSRFDRDVLGQSSVRYLIVLEGINDLGGFERYFTEPARMAALTQQDRDQFVARILGAYEQIITRAHAHNIKVYGATITADTGSDYYHPSAASEAQRQAVNAWIRAPGHFDAVIDFDKATADPANPRQLLPAYDSGDHLHPGPAGYRAMGQAIDLALFQ